MKGQSLVLEFEAIGTKWVVNLALAQGILPAELETKILNLIEDFDKNYSRFRTDSLVTRMFKQPGAYTLPQNAKPLLDLYWNFYKISDGSFTPLIGNALREAGYNENYSLNGHAVGRVAKWEEALAYDFPELKLNLPVMLDFGAAGKGYLVDLVGELLFKEGVKDFCVDAGGDILQASEANEALKIGLEDPENFEQAVGIVNIQNQSLCGSALNRRVWGSYSHILDPRTLSSPSGILAVWAVAKTAILADALTTALFFMRAEKLKKWYDFEYIILKSDRSAEFSPNFPGQLFT